MKERYLSSKMGQCQVIFVVARNFLHCLENFTECENTLSAPTTYNLKLCEPFITVPSMDMINKKFCLNFVFYMTHLCFGGDPI